MGAFFALMPKVWPIIKNIGLVWDTFRLISKVIEEIAKRDVKIPTAQEVSSIIGAGRKLLDQGVIDIPGIDEKEISLVLAQIEVRIVGATEKMHSDVAKLEAQGISMRNRA